MTSLSWGFQRLRISHRVKVHIVIVAHSLHPPMLLRNPQNTCSLCHARHHGLFAIPWTHRDCRHASTLRYCSSYFFTVNIILSQITSWPNPHLFQVVTQILSPQWGQHEPEREKLRINSNFGRMGLLSAAFGDSGGGEVRLEIYLWHRVSDIH